MTHQKPHRVSDRIAYRLSLEHNNSYRLDFSIIVPLPKIENGGMRHVIIDEPCIKLSNTETIVNGCRVKPKLSIKLVAEVAKFSEQKVLRRLALEKAREGSPILV